MIDILSSNGAPKFAMTSRLRGNSPGKENHDTILARKSNATSRFVSAWSNCRNGGRFDSHCCGIRSDELISLHSTTQFSKQMALFCEIIGFYEWYVCFSSLLKRNYQ